MCSYNYISIDDKIIVSFDTAYTCNSLPQVSNGVISYGPDTTSPFDYGTIATYLCNEGYYSTDMLVRSCSGSGSSVEGFWVGQEPLCQGN